MSCVLFVASHNLWHYPTGGGYRWVREGWEGHKTIVPGDVEIGIYSGAISELPIYALLCFCQHLKQLKQQTVYLHCESVGTSSLLWSCITSDPYRHYQGEPEQESQITCTFGSFEANNNWQVATSKHRYYTDHPVACSPSLVLLTACEEYKPLGVCLNISMSALPKTSQKNSGNRTATAC